MHCKNKSSHRCFEKEKKNYIHVAKTWLRYVLSISHELACIHRQQIGSFQMEELVQKYHHDFSKVGDKSPVNDLGIVIQRVPDCREGVGDQVDYRNT